MYGFIIALSMWLLLGWSLIGQAKIDVWNSAPQNEKEIIMVVMSRPFCEKFNCEEAELKGIGFGDTIYFFAKCSKFRI